MSFISRKRKPKDVEEESKNLQGRFVESLTQEFKKLSLKSSKRIKGRKENNEKRFTQFKTINWTHSWS